MPLRYLICDQQLSCEDFTIIGELISPPKTNQEYVYRNRLTNQIISTGKTICNISPSINNNADLRLILDDNTAVNIIVL